jgi:hypothetical protein
MEGIIDAARNMPVLLDRRQALIWIDGYYKQKGIDPLDIRLTEEFKDHFLNAVAMMPAVIAGALGRLDLDVDELRSVGNTDSLRWFHGYNVWKHGSQTFKITPALASKLLLTEIHELSWEDFHLPFPSIVIQVPSHLVTLHDPETGEHPLDTIMITEAKKGDSRVVSFLFLGQENQNSKGVGDDSVVYLNLFSRDGEMLGDSLDRTTSRPGDLRGVDAPFTLGGDRSRQAMKQAVQFAINIITYINSRPEDVVREFPQGWDKLKEKAKRLAGRKRDRILQKMKALKGDGNPFVVGSHVTIDKNLERAAQECHQGSRDPASVASYVRGHWRNQAHGPQHSLRRIQWIEPHWRNLEAEPVIKDYTVR